MELRLKTITIENFKGIKDLTINFNDDVTHIGGKNASGKTSIADAFSWLLYDKNSKGDTAGSSNFTVKPLDDEGKEIPYLDTMVEAEMTLDGAMFNLKRIQKENWVKKRGQSEAVYAGNTSTYYINDVETKQSDFKKRIADIANDDVIRYVSVLSAFNNTEWKKRREVLLTLSGVDVDGTLLAKDKYTQIGEFLEKRNINIDDMRKLCMEQRRKLNDDLKRLPDRVDEASKAITDNKITDEDIAKIEKQIADITAETDKLGKKIAELQAGDDSEIVKTKLNALQESKKALVEQLKKSYQSEANTAQIELNDYRAKQAENERENSANNKAIGIARERKRRLETAVLGLRDDYKKTYASSFVYEGETNCPVCGQALPESKIQEAREKAENKFNEERSKELERVTNEGKEKAAELELTKQELADLQEKEEMLMQNQLRLLEAVKERERQVEALGNRNFEEEIANNEQVQELDRQIEALDGAEITNTNTAEIEQTRAERDKKLQDIVVLMEKKTSAQHSKAAVERVEELKQQISDAGNRLNIVEQTIALIDEFVIERCNMLEESINDCFPSVRWKLFDTQINGGIVETCVCMIPCESGLIPYESANTASAIKADVEIINVLGKHFNAYMPLFLDNAERVNVIPETDNQLITLSVTDDEELTIKDGIQIDFKELVGSTI